MVIVDSGPIIASYSPNDVPKDKWDLLINKWCATAKISFRYDCRELARYIDEAEKYGVWKELKYDSLEDFIERGLELQPEVVSWAYEGLRFYEDAPVSLAKAADKGQKVREMRDSGMTQQAIADAVGVSRQRVQQIATLGSKTNNTRQFGWMPVSPADAAAKIREKFGDEFANALKVQL